MFMRRQLKQGNLFHLDKKNHDQQEMFSADKFNKVESGEIDEQNTHSEQNFRNIPPKFTDFTNVQQIAQQNSMAVAFCGTLFCCLCFAIFFGLFYFFLFDYVKEYIPFYQSPQDPLKFLTQQNAKQYFARNQMIAGQFHYARVPVEYWNHRIQMVKSMGMNTLSVYVFWNYHEVEKGKFNFQTGNKNLTHFLDLCKELQMDILLRPGPYVSAEWDFAGLPVRLMAIEGMEIRSSNPLFIEETRIYFKELTKVIRKYIKNKQNPSGPILMIQVQNEPGWYTTEVLYIEKLRQLWNDQIKINCPLYFDDTIAALGNSTTYWKNAIIGMNPLLYDSKDYEFLQKNSHFVFGGEIYSGWFQSWGGWEPWEKQFQNNYLGNFTKQFSNMLADNRSFSVYMAHGGTNFGLTAGFNLVTSYDYSAPISEQGLATTNYHIFRSIVMNYTNIVPPKIPPPIQSMQVTFGKLKPINSLFDNLPLPLTSQKASQPLPFQSNQLQMFNQGMVMYTTTISGPKQYSFLMIIHDVGLIFIDGEYTQTVLREKKKMKLQWERKNVTIECKKESCKLEILIEAMGHVNFGKQMNFDKKGIAYMIEKGAKQPMKLKWSYYKFDVGTIPEWKNTQKCQKAPCLYYIEANLKQTKDTYIDVKDLKKGYVWVNGINLGRYWDVGPQYRLYCPGVWLKKGKNKIVVLDLYLADSALTIKGKHTLQ